MKLFKGADIANWTGGDVADAVMLPKPISKSDKVQPRKPAAKNDAFMAEYAMLADIVGVPHPDAKIEAFKDFLSEQDWAVFSLAEVVSYMDKKAKAESKEQAGWHWCPLRECDNISNVMFGTAASAVASGRFIQHSNGALGEHNIIRVPASDYYSGPYEKWTNYGNGQQSKYDAPASARPYDKVIPLHALRKVAKIESDFALEEYVSFFVCDYAPAPHIQYPDPFLMAVIKNDKLASGVGRFIIDFWDEPGFGLEQQLA